MAHVKLLAVFIVVNDILNFGGSRRICAAQLASDFSCKTALGMQSGWVQDADVTASSMKDLIHDPAQARLHSNRAWMPFIHDANQFLQIHFQNETSILQVAIQGHPIEQYWVTQYSLASSMDAKIWEEIPEVFEGNIDRWGVVTTQLIEPTKANFVRIQPKDWNGAIALRMEIYGCMKDFPKCGERQRVHKHSRQKRIVGGKDVLPNAWPWQVELLINGTQHWCGGSIIHPQWISTSAHCVHENISSAKTEIRLGEHNSKKLEGYEEIIQSDRVLVHPGYVQPTNFTPGDYDFALLRLERPATFYERVGAVCLPDEDTTIGEDAGRICFVTGWGHTTEQGSSSDILQENRVPIVSREVCNRNESYDGIITERFMCAGYEEGGLDACQGDSGGPLVCQDGAGKWVLIGVVSWGTGCARPYKYGVYSDVRRFLPFIESSLYGYPECGTRSLSTPSSRIVGGREASPNSWPWQVDLLIHGTDHHCGGSLIGPSWVVTSAHCFYRYKRSDQWQVRVGEHNETKYEGYEEMIAIQRIIIHPGFYIGSEIHTGDYDIAIIRLKRPAVFHKRVHSICLPNMETSFPAGKTCYATGWGKQDELASSYSEVLREVPVNLVSKEVCNSNISYNGMLNERYMCAGSQEGGKDSCYGDSGGPLACESENGSFVLTGVVSWGEGCARPNKYGVYLDVRYMLPFIESTLHGYPKCGTRFLPAQAFHDVGGPEAHPNSWPWQVELLSNNTHTCSGALIDEWWVITSGNCVGAVENPRYWEARLGEHNVTLFEGYEERIAVENIFVGPRGEIALMRLKRKALFHDRVVSVCLPEERTAFNIGDSCYASGWSPHFLDVLKEVHVELVSNEVCNVSAGGVITKYERCARTKLGGDGACNLENGGPLVCPGADGRFILAGVAVSGDWCSSPGKYGVFTDIKMVLSFINRTVTMS